MITAYLEMFGCKVVLFARLGCMFMPSKELDEIADVETVYSCRLMATPFVQLLNALHSDFHAVLCGHD